MSDAIRRENDFVLNYAKLVAHNGAEFDITGHLVEFSFEENIFLASIHGYITLIDSVDYFTLLPIIGEERVKISITRQDEKSSYDNIELLPPLEFDCPVYKISGFERGSASNKLKTYSLYFTSDEHLKSKQTKVLKGFVATPFSEIVETVYNEKMKVNFDIVVEPTKFDQDWCISNIAPIGAIMTMASRSISEATGNANYVFYQDRDQFNFVSIESLINAEPAKKIRFKLQNILEDGPADQHKDRDPEDLNTVQHYHHAKGFNLLEHLDNGKGSSRLITVDIVRQIVDVKDFDLDAEYERFPHLGNAKTYTSNSKILGVPEACVKLVSTNIGHDTEEHIVSRDPTIKPKRIEEIIQYKKSFAEQIGRNLIQVQLSGDPRLKAGQVIEFDLPEMMGKVSESNPQELDKYLQGKYLIVAISHFKTQNGYYANMELVKDSFFQDINFRDPIEEYDDIF